MACAHAKFTGEVGVCMATSGPGAIHLLNGLYDAKMDHQPVVAIVGQQAQHGARRRLPAGGRPDLALQGRRARVRAHGDRTPRRSRHLVDRAMRIALAERTVTCIIVPNDVQELQAVEEPPHAHGTVHSASATRAPRVIARATTTCGARRTILNAGEARGHAGRRGRARRHRRGDRGRRAARRRRRQGAARQGGAARRRCRSSPARSACSAPSRAGT